MKNKVVLLTISLSAAMSVNATVITPDFANVPNGWAADRYAPNSFSDVGTFEGRNNVLGIGINAGDQQQATFYDTQGEGYNYVNQQGPGSVLSADLYIPSAWENSANGLFRSDMWAVGVDATGTVQDYAVIGFTDQNGTGTYRIWNDQTGIWTYISSPVAYNAWTSFSISFNGTSFVYSIDGTQVGALANSGSTSISEVIMQAYNFGGTYTADWSNTPVPEPTTIVAGAMLLLPFGLSGLRMLRKSRMA